MIAGAQSSDSAARERIRYSLQESLLVEASAGTGKTSELVRRIVHVLEQGLTTVDRIVAVTFTQKAAGELKLRLRNGIDRRRAKSTDPRHLEHALAHLEEAAIGTIHAFCAQILRERPVEARVDPDFEELDEHSSRRVYAAVFDRWLQEKLNQESPGLRRALARLANREQREQDYTPVESLEYAGWALMEWRDFPAAWRRAPFDREPVIDTLVEHVRELGDVRRYAPSVRELIRDLRPWLDRQPRDYDTLEGLLMRLHRVWKKEPASRRPGEKLFEALENFRPVMEADLAAELRAELWELVERYDAAKRRAGKLDFVDLLLLVRNLVRDNRDVREYLQQKFTHLFVDEFQDTDPLQAEILMLLSASDGAQTSWLDVCPSPGKLFLVGDPKQSIYKFRRADVQLYQTLRDKLEQRGVGILQLSRSYRAVRSIQHCVNAAFAGELNGDRDSAQAEYVPLDEERPDIAGQPAVIVLPVPEPYSSFGRITKTQINASLPGTIVGFVEWLVKESGWKVGNPENPQELVPVSERHVCILFRRFMNFGEDLTRDYVRGLEDRGISHLLVGSRTFHWREEIDSVRAALTAVEWPDDELAVFATLKGALFGISDHVLFRFRHDLGHLYPFREFETDVSEFEPVLQALKVLAELHRERNRRPLAETVYRLLEATRAWSAFAFRPAGHQALANVRRVIDLARQFEISGGISFRGFVEELTAQAEKAESAEAPVLEEGAEGVRIMTVHTAKGLEFPVVILADITANLSRDEPEKHVDGRSGLCAMRLLRCAPWELTQHEAEERLRERAEGVRVAYVAATRARDILVVPAVGDEERDGWVAPLNKAVYPAMTEYRLSRTAPGCPRFGERTVFNRPPMLAGEIGVKPGLHAPRTGEHEVVWWDPSVLPTGQEEYFGNRQQELLAEDQQAEAEGLRIHDEWLARRSEVLEKGARPAFDLLVASEAVQLPSEWAGTVEIATSSAAMSRPSGKRFGALVHNTLAVVALDCSREQIEATAGLQGRMLASPKEEITAAARAVEAALRHPLLDRARAAKRCHREYPVVVSLEGSRLLEGVIDLAFEEDTGWTIVDFKSDADLALRLPHYQAQIGWYAVALERITNRPVHAVLLRV